MIPNKNVPQTIWRTQVAAAARRPSTIPQVFRRDQMGLKLFIVPIREVYHLNLTFPLEDYDEHYQAAPGTYLSRWEVASSSPPQPAGPPWRRLPPLPPQAEGAGAPHCGHSQTVLPSQVAHSSLHSLPPWPGSVSCSSPSSSPTTGSATLTPSSRPSSSTLTCSRRIYPINSSLMN